MNMINAIYNLTWIIITFFAIITIDSQLSQINSNLSLIGQQIQQIEHNDARVAMDKYLNIK